MQSLNASTVPSLAGSRPTTPHSTVSTMPVGQIPLFQILRFQDLPDPYHFLPTLAHQLPEAAPFLPFLLKRCIFELNLVANFDFFALISVRIKHINVAPSRSIYLKKYPPPLFLNIDIKNNNCVLILFLEFSIFASNCLDADCIFVVLFYVLNQRIFYSVAFIAIYLY